ncbi:uncharacterized protein LOC123559685 isoform X2 [Mercenaria mercenaria]|uniref:uncharacterized protein LOC123559685 isoform X2 n=1 Tax=Mercenaria mercenaria TaxID=6596 RepID=UPI00234F29D3|nr:uncharacterized protein LOC123559685 isoform X2 [Mercenaria mercenaria]
MSIGNESLSPQRYDVTPGYIAFFYLRKRHHMEVLTCSVMNDALTSPLYVTTRVYVKHAPEIEFNISGSELNISKGEQAFVKCSAKSALALNISWIERIDGRDIKKKQCHMTTYCGIAIDAHLVPQRHLFCQTHYLHKIDRKDLTVYILDAPEIEFNISGSELNISKGEQAFVKCSTKSAPVSNISWIESIDGKNITKKQCHMTTYCVIAINAHLVPQWHLFCQTHSLHKFDRKDLTVYIWGEDDQLSKDQEDSASGDKLIFWIIVGSCIAIVAFVSIAVIIVCLVVRCIKQRKAREQETNREIYIASDDGDRGGLEVAGRKS